MWRIGLRSMMNWVLVPAAAPLAALTPPGLSPFASRPAAYPSMRDSCASASARSGWYQPSSGLMVSVGMLAALDAEPVSVRGGY